MNTSSCRSAAPKSIWSGRGALLTTLAVALLLAGCGSPSAANIELRKKNQTLEDQVKTLTTQHERDVQTIAALQSALPTVPTLPADRLAMLYTTHGLDVMSSSSGDNPDPTAPFDTELKLVVNTVDQDGTSIKSAGSFRIEAFDLDDPARPLIGTWQFDDNQARALFFSRFGSYGYVLACPWQTKPAHPNLTVKVSFTDRLTGLPFVAQKEIRVRPPK